MKLQIEIPREKLMFLTVPDDSKSYKIVNYGYAGVWLVENNSTGLNAWKTKLPNGKYEVIGPIKCTALDIEGLGGIGQEKNFIIRCL